jgi:hypothetical protein
VLSSYVRPLGSASGPVFDREVSPLSGLAQFFKTTPQKWDMDVSVTGASVRPALRCSLHCWKLEDASGDQRGEMRVEISGVMVASDVAPRIDQCPPVRYRVDYGIVASVVGVQRGHRAFALLGDDKSRLDRRHATDDTQAARGSQRLITATD